LRDGLIDVANGAGYYIIWIYMLLLAIYLRARAAIEFMMQLCLFHILGTAA